MKNPLGVPLKKTGVVAAAREWFDANQNRLHADGITLQVSTGTSADQSPALSATLDRGERALCVDVVEATGHINFHLPDVQWPLAFKSQAIGNEIVPVMEMEIAQMFGSRGRLYPPLPEGMNTGTIAAVRSWLIANEQRLAQQNVILHLSEDRAGSLQRGNRHFQIYLADVGWFEAEFADFDVGEDYVSSYKWSAYGDEIVPLLANEVEQAFSPNRPARAKYACPVCGYPSLLYPPFSNNESCLACGFNFLNEPEKMKQWRTDWIQKGMPWSYQLAAQPLDWNPSQLLEGVSEL